MRGSAGFVIGKKSPPRCGLSFTRLPEILRVSLFLSLVLISFNYFYFWTDITFFLRCPSRRYRASLSHLQQHRWGCASSPCWGWERIPLPGRSPGSASAEIRAHPSRSLSLPEGNLPPKFPTGQPKPCTGGAMEDRFPPARSPLSLFQCTPGFAASISLWFNCQEGAGFPARADSSRPQRRWEDCGCCLGCLCLAGAGSAAAKPFAKAPYSQSNVTPKTKPIKRSQNRNKRKK